VVVELEAALANELPATQATRQRSIVIASACARMTPEIFIV
jgi:hypothetical protein